MNLGKEARLQINDKDNYGSIIVESRLRGDRYELYPTGGYAPLGKTNKEGEV